MFLMGHPIKAYTSKLELDTNRSWSKEKFYWVISDIRVISGSMGLVKCEDFCPLVFLFFLLSIPKISKSVVLAILNKSFITPSPYLYTF